jgi:beta-N-acetylhexosaminidase
MPKKLVIIFLLLAAVCFADEKYQRPGPVRLTRDGDKWAQKTLRKMPLEDKIGQLLMVRANTAFYNVANPDFVQLLEAVRRYHIGSILLTVPAEGSMVYKNQPYEAAMFTNQLQRESQLPLLFAADFERGLAMRFNGTTGFPHAMAFAATGKPSYVGDFARVVAQESRAIGVQWDFFPVADVNSMPANPIINTRAFGEDPAQVSDFVTAFLAPARENGLLTTAKHFPGHGDTSTDSHTGAARIPADHAHLESVELAPFRAAIAAGVDAVMVAHVTVPALDPDPTRVATTSRPIVTGLLKNELGFQGLVVTDAMDMNAVTRLYPPGRAAVEALKAGNDIIVVPADLGASFNALLQAAHDGEIPPAKIDASVLKILHAKASLGLHKARLVDVSQLATLIARPENLALAQRIADEAVTLVRDNGHLLPIKAVSGTPRSPYAYHPTAQAGDRLLVVVFSDDIRAESGRTFERQLRARVPDANFIFVDPRSATAFTPQVLDSARKAQAVVAAVLITPTAGKMARVQGNFVNTVSLDDATTALMRSLVEEAAPKMALVSLGNPYLASGFPQVENYLCTFSDAPVSEISAVKALFGEIAIHGRLPVTIPAIAQRGAGLDRPPLAGRLRRPTSAVRAR